MVEKEILRLLREGDETALSLIRSEYGRMIRYVIRGILNDRGEEEECENDVYMQIWNKHGHFDPEKGKLSFYITAIARNAALNRKRARRGREVPMEEGLADRDTPESLCLKQEEVEALKRAVSGLSSQ